MNLKKEIVMTRRLGLLAVVGLLSGLLVGVTLSSPSLTHARATKSRIKARARQIKKATKTKWESLSPEEQERVRAQLQTGAKSAQEQWEAMSAEEQQAVKEKARAGIRRARKAWKKLPDN
jgi:tRNA/tmRNA/rRNA uracil-C5-methylase (TrmA/RlmC/RlmD family)